jgi:hypothetical protein
LIDFMKAQFSLAGLHNRIPGVEGQFCLEVSQADREEIVPPATSRYVGSPEEEGNGWWAEEGREEVKLWLPRFGLKLHLFLPQKKVEVKLAEVAAMNVVQHRNVLRVLYFFGFIENRGLLLHASGLVRGNRAYVFPGVSDAGKTTIVRHSSWMAVLSDELVAVRLNGNRDAPVAFGTPFYGDWGRPGEEINAPIQGLYFPVKSTANRLEPLRPGETLTRLLRCIFSYTVFPARLEKLVDYGVELALKLPGFAFYFKPGAEMWEAIDGP